MHEAPGSIPRTTQTRLGDFCYPTIKEIKAGESEVQGYPWLHSKSETSMDYMKPYLKILRKELLTQGTTPNGT